MSNNTTLYIAFDCPKEDKTVWIPNQPEICIKFDGGKLNGNMDVYFKNIIDTDDVKTISFGDTVIYTG